MRKAVCSLNVGFVMMVESSIIKAEILRKLHGLWKCKDVFLQIDFSLDYSQISDAQIFHNLGLMG